MCIYIYICIHNVCGVQPLLELRLPLALPDIYVYVCVYIYIYIS